MKNVKILVTSNQTGHHFDLFLKLTGWWDFCGNWSCLPGYLFDNGGYFNYNSGGKFLGFYDRPERVSEVIFNSGWHELYMSLEAFSDGVSVGNKGQGNIFLYGAKEKELYDPTLGYVNHEITWEVVNIT